MVLRDTLKIYARFENTAYFFSFIILRRKPYKPEDLPRFCLSILRKNSLEVLQNFYRKIITTPLQENTVLYLGLNTTYRNETLQIDECHCEHYSTKWGTASARLIMSNVLWAQNNWIWKLQKSMVNTERRNYDGYSWEWDFLLKVETVKGLFMTEDFITYL